MTEPMPEPTDAWSAPPGVPLVLMEGLCTPGGAPVHRINGQDVPPSVLSAVRAASRAWAVEVRELREDLRQQQLRQKLAEREATDLRAEMGHYAVERDQLRGLVGEALDLALSYMRPVPLPEHGAELLTPPPPAVEQAWREGVAEILRIRREAGLT